MFQGVVQDLWFELACPLICAMSFNLSFLYSCPKKSCEESECVYSSLLYIHRSVLLNCNVYHKCSRLHISREWELLLAIKFSDCQTGIILRGIYNIKGYAWLLHLEEIFLASLAPRGWKTDAANHPTDIVHSSTHPNFMTHSITAEKP